MARGKSGQRRTRRTYQKGAVLNVRSNDGKWVMDEGENEEPVAVLEKPALTDSTTWTVKDGDEHCSSMKLERVRTGELREKILKLAESLGYHCDKLFLIDGSTRTAHSNAFCTGFGSFRRICLFDTLLTTADFGEILANRARNRPRPTIPRA